MAVILDFAASRHARPTGALPNVDTAAEPEGCEVVIFPGIRIVRHCAEAPAERAAAPRAAGALRRADPANGDR